MRAMDNRPCSPYVDAEIRNQREARPLGRTLMISPVFWVTNIVPLGADTTLVGWLNCEVTVVRSTGLGAAATAKAMVSANMRPG